MTRFWTCLTIGGITTKMPSDRKNLNLNLYKTVYLIRRSEELIIENYESDEMKTPMHMSMGSEAISAGCCLALGTNHQAFGTYRSHGLYLAKTGDVEGFFGEMYGKTTGVVKGKGGSMHLISPEHNLLGVSAIVASTIPLALGAAFVNKQKKNGKVVAVFFGDGATDEGVFWESLNIACLMKLPVLFICEDNGLAVHTATHLRRGYDSLTKIISQYKINFFEENTTDPEVIYNLTLNAIAKIEKDKTPAFIQLKYYRYLEHVGVHEDFQAGYRSKDEFEKWKRIDPYLIQRKKLLGLKFTEKQIQELEAQISEKIYKSLESAQKTPFPQKEDLYNNVYQE